MVGHRSTGLPECGPTESSAPEPCFIHFDFFFVLQKQREELENSSLNKTLEPSPPPPPAPEEGGNMRCGGENRRIYDSNAAQEAKVNI